MDDSLLKKISLPLIVLGAAASLYFVWNLLDLPSDDSMVHMARMYFDRYGLITVFVSAFIEGFLFLGVYYPGSLVIFLGVIFSIGNPERAIETVLLVIVALFLAYCANYLLGKYGWYRLLLAFGLHGPLLKAEQRLSKYGTRAMFLTYWHPNLAALTATAAGILRLPFAKFSLFSFLAVTLWCTFWGIVVYYLGDASLSLMGMPFILFFISVWIVLIILKSLHEKRRSGVALSNPNGSTNA